MQFLFKKTFIKHIAKIVELHVSIKKLKFDFPYNQSHQQEREGGATAITAEMTPKFNLRSLNPKKFQLLERYIAIKCKLAEITLKFNLRGCNAQKFPVSGKVYGH